jgi:hypothetical protein
MVLIIATVTATFNWLELRKLLLPVSEHVRLDPAKLAHFTYRKITLCWNGWQLHLGDLLIHTDGFLTFIANALRKNQTQHAHYV